MTLQNKGRRVFNNRFVADLQTSAFHWSSLSHSTGFKSNTTPTARFLNLIKSLESGPTTQTSKERPLNSKTHCPNCRLGFDLVQFIVNSSCRYAVYRCVLLEAKRVCDERASATSPSACHRIWVTSSQQSSACSQHDHCENQLKVKHTIKRFHQIQIITLSLSRPLFTVQLMANLHPSRNSLLLSVVRIEQVEKRLFVRTSPDASHNWLADLGLSPSINRFRIVGERLLVHNKIDLMQVTEPTVWWDTRPKELIASWRVLFQGRPQIFVVECWWAWPERVVDRSRLRPSKSNCFYHRKTVGSFSAWQISLTVSLWSKSRRLKQFQRVSSKLEALDDFVQYHRWNFDD